MKHHSDAPNKAPAVQKPSSRKAATQEKLARALKNNLQRRKQAIVRSNPADA